MAVEKKLVDVVLKRACHLTSDPKHTPPIDSFLQHSLIAMRLTRDVLLMQEMLSAQRRVFVGTHLRAFRLHVYHPLRCVRLASSFVRDDWPDKVIGCLPLTNLPQKRLLIG